MKPMDQPVDGQTFDYWELSTWSDQLPCLRHFRATFHVNTSWREHPWSGGGDSRGGADFINEWSVDSEAAPGRWTAEHRGLANYRQSLEEGRRVPFFTLQEAQAALRECMAYELDWTRKKLAQLTELEAQLKREIG